MQRQTGLFIRHTKIKLMEEIKDKRTDVLIICLLSSSNDLRTLCSKYQSVIYHSHSIFIDVNKTTVCVLSFVVVRYKSVVVWKHQLKIRTSHKTAENYHNFLFLSLFCVFSGLLCKWWHHPSFFMSSFQTLNTKEFPF